MNIDDQVKVTLTVERSGEDWWNVHVDDPAGGSFAMASAGTLHHALRGAVACVECAFDEVAGPFGVRAGGGS